MEITGTQLIAIFDARPLTERNMDRNSLMIRQVCASVTRVHLYIESSLPSELILRYQNCFYPLWTSRLSLSFLYFSCYTQWPSMRRHIIGIRQPEKIKISQLLFPSTDFKNCTRKWEITKTLKIWKLKSYLIHEHFFEKRIRLWSSNRRFTTS